MRGLRQVRWRLTAWYVGTLCAILLLLGAGLFATLAEQGGDQLDASLEESARSLARAVGEIESRPGAEAAAAIAQIQRLAVPERQLYVLAADGAPLGAGPVPAWLGAAARAAAARGKALGEQESDSERTVRYAAVALRTASGGWLVAVATADRVEWEEQHTALLAAFGAATVVAVVLMGIGGYVLARRSMAPIETTFGYMRRFTADAAHELRAPLAVLRTRIEFALRQPATAGPVGDVLREIATDAERLGVIVDDLLTLARADAGEQPAERERVFLDDAVTDAAQSTGIVARAKGVTLEMPQFDDAVVLGDRDRLRRLAVILLDNAIKFTPAGGTVSVRVGRAGGRPFLAVADTGAGIPAEHLPHVFERFYRADAARTTERGAPGESSGVGLGLSIARWIADAHGGEIDIRSVVGSGTTVTVSFPPAPQVARSG